MRRAFNILLFFSLILYIALLTTVNVDADKYNGIAFKYDQGFGLSNDDYAIHDIKTGKWLTNVNTKDVCAGSNVICPLHVYAYLGYSPLDSDHVVLRRYLIYWRWTSYSSFTGIHILYVQKAENVPYHQPLKLNYQINIDSVENNNH